MEVGRDRGADRLLAGETEHVGHRRAHVLQPAAPVDDRDDVARVLDQRAEPRLALAEHLVRVVGLADQSHDAPGNEDRRHRGDDPERDRAARRRGVGQHGSRRREEPDAEQHRARGPRPPHRGDRGVDLALRAVQHRRREEDVGQRPEEVEDGAFDVRAGGDLPRIDDVGAELEGDRPEEQHGARHAARHREERVDRRDEQHDVHHRVGDGHQPLPKRPAGGAQHRLDRVLPHDGGGRDADDRAVDGGLAPPAPAHGEASQTRRERGIRREVHRVGVRVTARLPERVSSQVVDQIAGDEQGQPERDEQPREAVGRDPPGGPNGDHDDHGADRVVEEVLGRAVREQRGGAGRGDRGGEEEPGRQGARSRDGGPSVRSPPRRLAPGGGPAIDHGPSTIPR